MNQIKRMTANLKSLNSALPGLLTTIFLLGILFEVVLVWFMPDPLKYTIGLWIGVGAAVFMAIHMAVVISDLTDFMSEKQAKAKAVLHAVLRYGIVTAAFGIMAFTDIGYVLAALLGALTLKISAYLQPVYDKIKNKANVKQGGETCGNPDGQ